jgi:drug/metabolite transporter (DMT)-like permease
VYTSIRMAAGTLAMFALLVRDRSTRPTGAEIKRLLVLGFLGHGVYQMLFIYGIARTRAGTAALVISSSPAIIAIVMRIFRNERLAPRAVIGIVLSIAGILVVMAGSTREAHGSASLVGDLMILAAVCCWAFYSLWLKPLTHLGGTQLAAWTLLGGAAPLAILASPSMLRTDFGAIVPLTWAAIAYSGLLSMGLAYLWWYRGVRVIGPTRTAMFANLQPIIAVLVSWPLLGETPTAWQGVGALGVMAGLWLTRQAPAVEPAHGE